MLRAPILLAGRRGARVAFVTHSAFAPQPGETFMRRFLLPLAALVACLPATAADLPKPLVTDLVKPESCAVGLDKRVYVTVIGGDKEGDGSVAVIDNGKAITFAAGLDDPKGLVAFKENLFTADKTRVWKLDKNGKATVFADAKAFPVAPIFLNDICADEFGNLYVTDSGNADGTGGAVFRIDLRGKVTLVADSKKIPGLKRPNGVLNESLHHLLLFDFAAGKLHRVRIADGKAEEIADGMDGGDGICFDRHGRIYLSSWKQGKVWVMGRPDAKPVLLAEGFKSAADICLSPDDKSILVPDMMAGTVTAITAQVPGAEVDMSPIAIETEVAFPNLQWTGWKGETDSGKPYPLRPILLTHAGDGSNRVFVPTQQGVVHVFPNDQTAAKTKIFLDITARVRYDDKSNEEGFLGMAFHPKYKTNGEFFIFYTDKKAKLENVVSRFRVSKTDPDVADPDSEEEIIRFSHRFWNHDGGTICFGPDGHLYIVVGDGGLANDPDDNGQNLNTHLGKILRIDVDKKEGKKYGIPKDNPFVGRSDAKPEIWAYGLRNPWRIHFDRKTGDLWLGEVGQNLWEEIIIVTKGGNYGWARREGLHPFGPKGVGPNKDMIDPIWEYHHDIGKSITGGPVYRGERLPELQGYYLYADYVSGFLRALKYDAKEKRVVEDRRIKSRNLPILSYGEDEKGDVYLTTHTPTGQGIYRFKRSGGKAE
jgi:glucose/arabinose dehydrogenase/sugar lactone lactonase YvrE